MMKRIALLSSLMFTVLMLSAQDPSFSQFYANRIYLNPAFTGLEPGLSVAGVARMQWLNVDGGYRTYGFSLELQEPAIKSGIGFSLFSDTEGLQQLKTDYIGFSYAYTLPLNKHNIHFGLQARWVQKSVDWSKIVFSDQLDPIHGNILPTSAVPVLDRVSFTDFDMGAIWRFSSDLKFGKKKFRDALSSIGFSLHHLPSLFNKNGGGESLQNLNTTTTPRFTFHAGTVIPLVFFNGGKKEIAISPNIKMDLQGEHMFNMKENLQVFSYGAYFLYNGVYFGALYQNKNIISHLKNTNAWIFAMGAYVKSGKDNSFFVGFSYDANTTGVGTRAGGVYEVAFRWTGAEVAGIFGSGRKKKNKQYLKCFNFF